MQQFVVAVLTELLGSVVQQSGSVAQQFRRVVQQYGRVPQQCICVAQQFLSVIASKVDTFSFEYDKNVHLIGSPLDTTP